MGLTPTNRASNVWPVYSGDDILHIISPGGGVPSWIDSTGMGHGALATGIGAQTNQINTFTAQQNFDANVASKGPNPWFDITRFGARGVSVSGTGSCTAGLNTVSVSTSAFVNGDGITMYGCGPNASVSSLSAPVVATGSTEDLTVPDATLSSNTGSSTFSYLGVARDKNGGLSAAGAATTINNGLNLGAQSASVTSASLTGNTLTLTFGATPNIGTNALFHFSGSTNAALSGWFQVGSSNATTITATVANYSASTITSTGGVINWFNGNQITFGSVSNLWQIYVCAKRPGDVSYHVIGATHPSMGSNDAAILTFTDWGSTITTAPTLPAYVTDAICSAVSSTPQMLTTTVASGGGTTSLTLVANASNSNSGQNVYLDNGPAILSADIAAQAFDGTVYVPTVGINNNGVFSTYSSITLNSYLYMQGNLQPAETLVLNGNVQGIRNQFAPQFAWNGSSGFHGNGAWPIVAFNGSIIQDVLITYNGLNAGLCLLMGTGNQQQINHVYTTTGTAGGSDYSGTPIVFVPTPFICRMSYVSATCGPSQTLDASWTPAVYLMTATATSTSTVLNMDNIYLSLRGIHVNQSPSWNLFLGVDDVYAQGCITPVLSVYGASNGCYLNLKGKIADDSAASPSYALWGPGSSSVTIVRNLQMGSQEAGGFPLPYSGTLQAIPSVNLLPIGTQNYVNSRGSGISGSQVWSPSLILTQTLFASLGTPLNGTFLYCADCTIANPCAGSGTGAFAKRLNGVWVCN